MPDTSGLTIKIDYNAKILDIESKHFIAFDYKKFTNNILKKESVNLLFLYL